MAPKDQTRNQKPIGKPMIKVRKNGPYIVSGKIPLADQIISTDAKGTPNKWRAGEEYPSHESYSLCRCGGSKTKPFCDGTHTNIRFDGAETATREPFVKQAKTTNGPELQLKDAVRLCACARFCHRAGGIWNLIRESGNPKAARIAIQEAGDCPSGRLVVLDRKTKRQIEPEFEKSIALVEGPKEGASGPIWVRGGIPVRSVDGKTYEIRNRVTLCRCGRSSNKPFCDSSHLRE